MKKLLISITVIWALSLSAQEMEIPSLPVNDITLLEAITAHDSKTVKMLLDKGLRPDTKDPQGRTGLHYAAYLGYPDIVALLLSKGADVNAEDSYNRTPLLEAVRGWAMYGGTQSRIDVVNSILPYNPKLIKDISGKTVLDYAVQYDDRPVLAALSRHQSYGGMTYLMQAAIAKDDNTATILLDNGADVNAQNNEGMTALMFATKNGYEPIVRLLLNRGADVYKHTFGAPRMTAAMFAALTSNGFLLREFPTLLASLKADKSGMQFLIKEYSKASND